MSRGSERDYVELTVKGEKTFAYRLSNDELRELRRMSEVRQDTFGAGTRVSIRTSELLAIVEELLQTRRKNEE